MKEVTDEQEDDSLHINASLINQNKKVTLKFETPKQTILEKLIKSKQYLEVHDFDEHFADVTCDWTNERIV